MKRGMLALTGVVATVACSTSPVPAAEASFPGRNGQIAFAGEGPPFNTKRVREGAWTIRVVNPRSGQTRQLTHVPRRCGRRGWTWGDTEPSFSASGRLLVYTHEDSCDPRTPDGIYTIRADGSGRRLIRLMDPDPDSFDLPEFPVFSPSGKFVAFNQYNGGGYILRVPRPGERALGSSCYSDPRCRQVLFPRYTQAVQPAWSSTGRLALALSGFDADGDTGHIGIAAPLTTETYQSVARLVTRSRRDAMPDWSPRGDRIVFQREKETRQWFEANVFTARARGKRHRRPRRLTETRDAFFPVWSPDGRSIAYVRDPDPDAYGSLWIMRAADGGAQRLILSRIIADRISWQPLPRR
jgi:Tol biopolymer transport system component